MSKFRNDPLFISRAAKFSDCRRYRYWLDIVWDPSKPMAAFIGLNPSTADEVQDDPTIRRCRGFAEREGCGGMRMLNLFAFRATDPKDMKTEPDPTGPENLLGALVSHITGPKIACWGKHGAHFDRGALIADAFGDELVCFGHNADGSPKHPLYLKSTAVLVPLKRSK